MKFGKRLASEASRRWAADYFDYKLLKKAIKDDIAANDALGTTFQRLLVEELQKVSHFYSRKAEQLETSLKALLRSPTHNQALDELRSEVRELIKYVALNYVAVVKAIKKRNRHLEENFGEAANMSLHALDLLMGEVFFTSPRLASLATQAEVLSQGALAEAAAAAAGASSSSSACQQDAAAASQLLEEYKCPVCLDTLHNPVVTTCAHRFCWGCLVAHATASRDKRLPLSKDKTGSAASFSAASSYRVVLEQIVSTQEPEAPSFYDCPVCRKPQLLDLDALQVDTFLSNFIEGLQAISTVTVEDRKSPSCCAHLHQQHQHHQQRQHLVQHHHQQHSCCPAPAAAPAAQPQAPWGIIPPQAPEHQGKLTVLLDMDGTLVSSFTPKRAPRLPPYIKTHVVGVGSKLNPNGVFVVERPGLTQFLEELSQFAEVIIFTAGLEDYARPIIEAIDPMGRFFSQCIWREGTLRTEYYQCVKDMGRVNRELGRVVLVDDTPLAFLHQPDNGIPVLGFRGDPDDRLLMEAVLPLLQSLSKEDDVRGTLRRRFDMAAWFKRHSFPVDAIVAQAARDAEEERARMAAEAAADAAPAATPAPLSPAAAVGVNVVVPAITPRGPPTRPCLLLTDFDRTLTDFDAGERVVEALAPELLPMLVGIHSPANFIPVTNTLLAELQRRGVARDTLLATLQALGAQELPRGTRATLELAARRGVDVKILSDCNSVFISHILAGARAAGLVESVITNAAGWERGAGEAESTTRVALGSSSGCGSSSSFSYRRRRSSGSGNGSTMPHKLVIQPRHGSDRAPHCCPLCPENLCKGAEVRALREQGTYRTIIYAGDGSNDICAALHLAPTDWVLARAGHPLAHYIEESMKQPGLARVAARVRLWSSHDELHQHAAELMVAGPVPSRG